MRSMGDFVGIPFADHGRESAGLDCWGGARMVLREVCGLRLPDYGNGYRDMADHEGIASSIRNGLAEGWQRVERPQAHDLVIFNICGQPRHVGVMVDAARFLHWPEGRSSRIERIADRMWCNRVEGYYRHVG